MLINILIFVAVIAAFFGAHRVLTAPQRRLAGRIGRIHARRGPGKAMPDFNLRRKTEEAKGLMHWLAEPLPDFKRLGDRLERAGKTISPKQYALRRLLAMIGIMLVVTLVFKKSVLIGLCAGIIIGVWLPLKLMQFTISRQSKAFLLLFPDAIDLIVRGLRSGLPVSESLVLVATQVGDPVGSVFANISNTMKLGVPLEKAMQETARKLDLTEFNFFTTSIILQRETGGNLSEILNNLSDVLRSRFLMRMKIKAMSSEARASSYIIGALPFVVLVLVCFTSPSYMLPLYEDYRGNICAAIAAGMMGFGMWVMNKMTQFEI